MVSLDASKSYQILGIVSSDKTVGQPETGLTTTKRQPKFLDHIGNFFSSIGDGSAFEDPRCLVAKGRCNELEWCRFEKYCDYGSQPLCPICDRYPTCHKALDEGAKKILSDPPKCAYCSRCAGIHSILSNQFEDNRVERKNIFLFAKNSVKLQKVQNEHN